MSFNELFSKLNEEQQEAVLDIHGPSMVIAGPGAGKTSVLVARTANMIKNGVPPSSILLFTFTKKAANEIRERINNVIGEEANSITIGTYHSLCSRILRQYCTTIGLNKRYTIYDQEDSLTVLKKIIKEFNTKCDIDIAVKKLAYYKHNMISPTDALREAQGQGDSEILFANIYERYFSEMMKNNCVDFDMLIYLTVRILEDFPDVKNEINKKYIYIVADESHDSSISDLRLIYNLAGEKENICMIADNDQCLLPGTKIKTINGYKNIEDINNDDKIIVASGGSNTTVHIIENLKINDYNGNVLKIKTESGKEIIGTPNHLTFAKIKNIANKYYVYLIYKHNYGFRIGRTHYIEDKENNNNHISNLKVRLNKEDGDKIWILKICNTFEESMYYEAYYSYYYGYYSYYYGIPNCDFSNTLKQDQILKLYQNINTIDRGLQLLKDKELFFEYPHYSRSDMYNTETNRRKLSFTMFADKRDNNYLHKLTTNSIDKEYSDIISEYIECYEINNKHTKYYNNTIVDLDYDKQWDIIKSIEERMKLTDYNFSIKLKAKLTEHKYDFTPFSNLMVGSIICIEKDGKIIEDKVISIEKMHYEGKVYDINVGKYRNYIANNIVVHNCIYGFRGSQIEAVMNMRNVFNNMKTHVLNTNYRSTQTIVNASRSLIEHNTKLIEKNLVSNNEKGESILYFQEKNTVNEANRIISLIMLATKKYNYKYNDIAILYRMNYLSRQIEDSLLKNKIPYKIIGGISFYNRKEIKDIMSYFKFIFNDNDSISLTRAIGNPKRSIGEKTIERIIQNSMEKEITLIDSIKELNNTGKTKNKFSSFICTIDKLKNNIDNETPDTLIRMMLDETDYLSYLEKSEKKEAFEDRKQNIDELIQIAATFDSMEEFVENMMIDIESIEDNENEEDCVKLLTIHSSKGLEWKVVIIVGANEGTIPSFRAKTISEIEEERRLAYVAMTRAKDMLFITRPLYTMVKGRYTLCKESRFLNEINKDYVFKFDSVIA